MKPLTLSFLVLSSIVLFAVLVTCEDYHRQIDKKIKNNSSIRVFSWVKEIIKHNSPVLEDSVDNLSGSDSLSELSDEDLQAMKRIIMSTDDELQIPDTISKRQESDGSVVYDKQ